MHWQQFWVHHPALFAGLHLLIGSSLALSFHWILFAPIILLWIPFSRLNLKIIIQGVCLLLFSWGCTSFSFPHAHLPKQQLHGIGYFSIQSIKPFETIFHQRCLLYEGTMHYFEAGENRIFHRLPCSIIASPSSAPKADQDYVIEGTLVQKGDYQCVCKPDRWKAVDRTWSAAQMRFNLKQKLQTFLHAHLHAPKVVTFFTALITGNIEDRSLSMEFNQIGLQHILAISGFHFSIMALFFGYILKKILPYSLAIIVLIVSLTGYFLFIGPSASVQRAWIAVIFYLIGQLFGLNSRPLNFLGLGLTIELLVNPLFVLNLGFQLSFLSTMGILLFYSFFKTKLNTIFIERSREEISLFPLLDRYGYRVSQWIKANLSLNASVYLVSLPVLLFLFHRFPLLSLIYNLFFPWMVTWIFGLLLCALILSPISGPLANFIYLGITWSCEKLLMLTTEVPQIFNIYLRYKAESFPILILVLTLILGLGVYYESKKYSSQKIFNDLFL